MLIICGPTATTKTNLGINLAKIIGGEIISADSRQIYRGMDIGTGKDLLVGCKPINSSLKYHHRSIPYYLIDKVKIWGYDLVYPDDDFSIANYYQVAKKILDHIDSVGKSPIIVGGSGHYIEALVNPPQTIDIPPNHKLRQELSLLNVDQLQQELSRVNPDKLNTFNQSDQSNPRRLIRAIEVTQTNKPQSIAKPLVSPRNINWLGLKADLNTLDTKIDQRVNNRTSKDFDNEVNALISKKLDWSTPALTATGYQDWKNYLEGKISKEDAINSWQLREKQYARRQLTWFSKNLKINWFDISDSNFRNDVVALVKNWYASGNEAE